jgi:hypothetical protein
VHDASLDESLASFKMADSHSYSIDVSPDGRLLACGRIDGQVELRAADDGRVLATLDAHTASLSYVRFDATGERLPGQPERESFARVQLGPPEQWKLIGEWQRTGDLLVSEGGGRFLPARTVWNARIAYDLASPSWLPISRWLSELWVYVEGNNLSDEAVRDTLAFPQPGRNMAAGFEASW